MPQTLNTLEDHFKGVTIDLAGTTFATLQEFEKTFFDTLNTLQSNGTRAVWVRVPIENSDYIPILVKNFSFVFHHADRTHLMVTRWLPDTTKDPNMIPLGCQHYVGVGAAVVDPVAQEILLVQEKFKWLDKHSSHWKIITGSLDTPGENVSDCAIREVFEESGIKAEFKAVLAVRHLHNFRFGKSDIHFLSILTPNTKEINYDPNEIAECKWVPLSEYYAMEGMSYFQQLSRERVKEYLDNNKSLKMNASAGSERNPAVFYHV